MPSIAEKRAAFRELHRSGCFVIPNPWDIGSARYLQHAGFKALASTSSGFAWTQGRPDHGITREMVLDHLRVLSEATGLPVNADFENGFADDPDGVAESVRLAIDTGIAGLSIEDSTGPTAHELFPLDVALDRLRAARKAIDASGEDVMLVGRAECFIAGMPDIGETVRRIKAYRDAGADILYAPGLRSKEQIEQVVAAADPKPVNVLVGGALPFSVADLAALGVRRISVGGGLAMVGWAAIMKAATTLAQGSFDGMLHELPPESPNQVMASLGS
ncbi:MAG: isocitrate lyase/PEP mutase family protein [Hyphomicrobiales bacterium]